MIRKGQLSLRKAKGKKEVKTYSYQKVNYTEKFKLDAKITLNLDKITGRKGEKMKTEVLKKDFKKTFKDETTASRRISVMSHNEIKSSRDKDKNGGVMSLESALTPSHHSSNINVLQKTDSSRGKKSSNYTNKK